MGNSEVTGRGLLALAGRGSIFQISLGAGEDYIAHLGYDTFFCTSLPC